MWFEMCHDGIRLRISRDVSHERPLQCFIPWLFNTSLSLAYALLLDAVSAQVNFADPNSTGKAEADLSSLARAARQRWCADVANCPRPCPYSQHTPSRAGPIQEQAAEPDMHSWPRWATSGTEADSASRHRDDCSECGNAQVAKFSMHG